jgi:hypothetical protein
MEREPLDAPRTSTITGLLQADPSTSLHSAQDDSMWFYSLLKTKRNLSTESKSFGYTYT